MKITIENTDQIVTVETRDGGKVPARVWRGVTDGGVECQLLVTRIAVARGDDNSAFERELEECPPARAEGPRAYDLRCFID
jgi:hypothetical protein